jgi:hypothetical protein
MPRNIPGRIPGRGRAGSAGAPQVAAQTVRAFFFITAPADPGLLPRLIEPIAKLGAIPSRVHASRDAGDGSEFSVDLRLSGVPLRTARLIECALRAIVGVRQVLAVVEQES